MPLSAAATAAAEAETAATDALGALLGGGGGGGAAGGARYGRSPSTSSFDGVEGFGLRRQRREVSADSIGRGMLELVADPTRQVATWKQAAWRATAELLRAFRARATGDGGAALAALGAPTQLAVWCFDQADGLMHMCDLLLISFVCLYSSLLFAHLFFCLPHFSFVDSGAICDARRASSRSPSTTRSTRALRWRRRRATAAAGSTS